MLVEGDDFNEPICDAVRAILDGHIILSRAAGARRATIRPSTFCTRSAGCAPRLSTPEQKEAARKIREALATHQRSEDLINLGAYASGANPKLDAAIRLRPQLLDFLKQDAGAHSAFDETMAHARTGQAGGYDDSTE